MLVVGLVVVTVAQSRSGADSKSGARAADAVATRGVSQSDTFSELVFIRGGTFVMGSPMAETGRGDGELERTVVVSDFRLAKTEVTNAQYARYLAVNPGARKPKFWSDAPWNQADQPVVGVTWEQAQAYATWANLRLPTEAEWEYAARAGTRTAYFSGNSEADLAAVGFYERNSEDALHRVGAKRPNAFGLYDVHGNAWEWCSDWYGPYQATQLKDPVGPKTGERRVARGGSWDDPAAFARSAHRVGYLPFESFKQVGFRVAADAK